MKKDKLERIAWKAVAFISKDRRKKYSQIDLMEHLNINIVEAIEISEFLAKMKIITYK
jgi:hypothetical protein